MFFSIIQPIINCKDPNTSIVPCTIGECTFENAMQDLGASINSMPTLVYKALQLRELKPTSVVI